MIVNAAELAPVMHVYRCYSPNQKTFLVENGCDYIYKYKNNQNGKTVWVFLVHERLSQLLKLWTENRPERGEPSAG